MRRSSLLAQVRRLPRNRRPVSRIRQIDLVRLIRGAEAAGWPRGSFRVVVEGARVTLEPVDPSFDEAAEIARRINSMEGSEVH